MERAYSSRFLCLSVALVLLSLGDAMAHANPIGYTVTDLGAGNSSQIVYPDGNAAVVPQFSTDANGNGIVIAPDGRTAYPFPRTPSAPAGPDILNALPPLTNAPVNNMMTYGNPNFAYSYFLPGGLYRNGIFVGTDITGVDGHSAGAGSQVMMSQRQPDGSFGPLSVLWSSPNNRTTEGIMARVIDMNSQNQVLGVTTNVGGSYWPPSNLLYDLKTKTFTDFISLIPNWQITSASALDDQGRILLTGNQFPGPDHLLLLTPDGLSSEPVPIPEPTTLTIFVLSLGGLVVHRRLKRGV